jgi:preprotein translocase subunit SecG
MNNKDENKEEFCAPCLMAVPLALGAGGVAGSGKGKNKTMKNIIFWSSIALIIISIVVYIMLRKNCKNCSA